MRRLNLLCANAEQQKTHKSVRKAAVFQLLHPHLHTWVLWQGDYHFPFLKEKKETKIRHYRAACLANRFHRELQVRLFQSSLWVKEQTGRRRRSQTWQKTARLWSFFLNT